MEIRPFLSAAVACPPAVRPAQRRRCSSADIRRSSSRHHPCSTSPEAVRGDLGCPADHTLPSGGSLSRWPLSRFGAEARSSPISRQAPLPTAPLSRRAPLSRQVPPRSPASSRRTSRDRKKAVVCAVAASSSGRQPPELTRARSTSFQW
jgi:hypothetical protein